MPERTAALNAAAEQLSGVRGELAVLNANISRMATAEDIEDARKRDARARKRWTVVLVLLVLVGVVAAFAAFAQARYNGNAADRAAAADLVAAEQAADLKALIHKINRTNDILIECTTPSTKNDIHECNEQSAAGQTEVIGELIGAIMASNACSSGSEVVAITSVRKCVDEIVGETP